MIHNLAAMIPRNKNLILNRVFLPGLLLLLVNDHFLKLYYPNWLTGKPVNLGDWKMLRRYARWYKARVKKYIIAEVE